MMMAWGEQTNLVSRFEAIVGSLKRMCPHWKLGRSYEGWIDALKREQERLVPHVIQRLRQKMTNLCDYKHCGRWEAYAVDGSKISCPRTLKNSLAMGESGKPNGMPLSSLTAVLHLRLGLPWAFRVGPGTDSERGHLKDMLAELPERALLVADAGFIGYELCCEMIARRQHFLLRVGGNIHLIQELGYDYEVQGQTVYLWPQAQQRDSQSPLELRLIVVRDEHKQPVYLATSVLDAQALTDQEGGEIYRLRWGVEVLFRTVKQTMERHVLRSRTPENCYLEMTWIFLGVWLMELMTVNKLVQANCDPREISPAQARNTIRRVMRNDRPCQRTRRSLPHVLAHCRKDSYQRHGPKASRNYPRKKRHQPPRPPKIKLPNEQQLQTAQRLTPIKMQI